MMTITPNFNFDGKCGEAISLYQQAFGAKVDCLLHYRDADQSDFKRELSEEQKDYVYHAELYIDGQRIMMADNLDIPFRPSTALSLTVTMSRKEEVLAAFEVLEDGGEVIYPPHSTTYSSCTTNVIVSHTSLSSLGITAAIKLLMISSRCRYCSGESWDTLENRMD